MWSILDVPAEVLAIIFQYAYNNDERFLARCGEVCTLFHRALSLVRIPLPSTAQDVVQCIRNNNILTFRGIAKANKYDFKSLLQAPHMTSELALHANRHTLKIFANYMPFYTYDIGCMLHMAGRPKLLSKLQLVTHEKHGLPSKDLQLIEEMTDLVHFILNVCQKNNKIASMVLQAYPQVQNFRVKGNKSKVYYVRLNNEYYQKYKCCKKITCDMLYTWAVLHDVHLSLICSKKKNIPLGADMIVKGTKNKPDYSHYLDIYFNILRFVIFQRLKAGTWESFYNNVHKMYKETTTSRNIMGVMLEIVITTISCGYVSLLNDMMCDEDVSYFVDNIMKFYCKPYSMVYRVPPTDQQNIALLMYIERIIINSMHQERGLGLTPVSIVANKLIRYGQPDILKIVILSIQSKNRLGEAFIQNTVPKFNGLIATEEIITGDFSLGKIGIFHWLSFPRAMERQDPFDKWKWISTVAKCFYWKTIHPRLMEAIKHRDEEDIGHWMLDILSKLSDLNDDYNDSYLVMDYSWSAMLLWGNIEQARKLINYVPWVTYKQLQIKLLSEVIAYRPEMIDIFFYNSCNLFDIWVGMGVWCNKKWSSELKCLVQYSIKNNKDHIMTELREQIQNCHLEPDDVSIALAILN